MSYYDYSYFLEDLGASLGASALLNIPTALFSIAAYVLTALTLYTIAKRRGIRHAWLSWIPVADVWILGSISDQYRYVAKGEVKSKRKLLIWFSALTYVVTIALVAVCVAVFVQALGGLYYGVSEDELLSSIMGPMLGAMGLLLPLVGLAITFAVFRYMALYDLFMSCDPENGVLFTVLSILTNIFIPVHIVEPLFLIFQRNKDKGMPPRRGEIPQAPNYQTYRSGGQNPAQNQGYQNPAQNQGYQNPAQNQGYQNPAQNQGYQNPAQNQGYQNPAQNQGYQNPAQNPGYRNPVQNPGYQNPQQPPQLPQVPRDDEEHFL